LPKEVLKKISKRTDRHIFRHLGYNNRLRIKCRARDGCVKICGGELRVGQVQSSRHQQAQRQRVETNHVFLMVCLKILQPTKGLWAATSVPELKNGRRGLLLQLAPAINTDMKTRARHLSFGDATVHCESSDDFLDAGDRLRQCKKPRVWER